MTSENKQDNKGVVTCTSCGSVYRLQRVEPTCANCGAPIAAPAAPIDTSRPPKFVGVLGFLKPVADSMDGMLKSGNLLRDTVAP